MEHFSFPLPRILSMSMLLPQGKHITYNCYFYITQIQIFQYKKIRNSKDVQMLSLRLNNFLPSYIYTLWASFLCNYDKSVTQTCLFADWIYSSSIGSAFKRIISARSQQEGEKYSIWIQSVENSSFQGGYTWI